MSVAIQPLTRRLIWPLVVAVLASGMWLAIRSKRATLVDFEVYRRAATRALDHAPLYRPEDGHYQFKYLPVFAFLMAPVTLVSDRAASTAWYALSVILLFLFVRLSLRLLPDRHASAAWLVWLVVICTGKFWVKELTFGQTNVLLGLVLAVALALGERGQWRAAAALVGVGAFIKPYAVLFVPWLAVVAGIEAAGIAVAVLAAGLVLPAFAYGWSDNLTLVSGWYHTVTDTTAPNLLDAENISFATMWAKWLGPGPLASKLALATSAAAVALVAAVLFLRRRVERPLYLEFALLMLMVPLLSPQGWDYVLLIAVPVFFCVFDRWRLVDWPWKAATAIAVFLVSFTIFDLVGRRLYVACMELSVVTVGALLLAACLAHLRWRGLA